MHFRKDLQQSVPFFSIKSSQTDQAGTAEENPETSGNQNPVSQRPVFDIHTDAEQENGGEIQYQCQAIR